MSAAFELNATLDAILTNYPADASGKFPTLDRIIFAWNNPQKRYDCFHQTFLRQNGFSARSPQPGEFVDLEQSSEGAQPAYSLGARSVLVVSVERSASHGEVYRVVGIESEFRGSPLVTFVPVDSPSDEQSDRSAQPESPDSAEEPLPSAIRHCRKNWNPPQS